MAFNMHKELFDYIYFFYIILELTRIASSLTILESSFLAKK